MAIAARESICDARRPEAWRAALVAADTVELTKNLLKLADAARRSKAICGDKVWLRKPDHTPIIAFLFSGTSTDTNQTGGRDIWTQRFAESRSAFRAARATSPLDCALSEGSATIADVKAVAAAGFAAWQVLERCNLDADIAFGDQLGQLTALTWAGVVDRDDFFALANTCTDKSCALDALTSFAFDDPAREVISAVTGGTVDIDTDVRGLIANHLMAPCDVTRSMTNISADLVIELGMGSVLTTAATNCGHRALAIDAHGSSVIGLLSVLGEAFVLGAPVNAAALYEDRRLPELDLWN
jgi:malonyl CoA-acyl carrier protein transacylase